MVSLRFLSTSGITMPPTASMLAAMADNADLGSRFIKCYKRGRIGRRLRNIPRRATYEGAHRLRGRRAFTAAIWRMPRPHAEICVYF